LAFRNGMVIPLLSEFLESAKDDTDNNKQDCEQRAFHRLSQRLKALFPRLPILLLLDGLYAWAGDGPLPPLSLAVHDRAQGQRSPHIWEEFASLQHHRDAFPTFFSGHRPTAFLAPVSVRISLYSASYMRGRFMLQGWQRGAALGAAPPVGQNCT
jgi:hypothetical protein